LGHARFEALLGQVRRLRPPVELRPDASLFALYTATGQCPPTHAMNRLGYCPRHDLATGLTAIARTSPQP
ncbi:MAG: hypothetical protein ORN49_06550, partial [Rhodobacteraceae bacterium]|nr:hypothetical protein [Paracoccaceae bacterium]